MLVSNNACGLLYYSAINFLFLIFVLCCYTGISNSFGFGGHNSVVVFAPFKP